MKFKQLTDINPILSGKVLSADSNLNPQWIDIVGGSGGSNFEKYIYVDNVRGDDNTATGQSNLPFKTVQAANMFAKNHSNGYTIRIMAGYYVFDSGDIMVADGNIYVCEYGSLFTFNGDSAIYNGSITNSLIILGLGAFVDGIGKTGYTFNVTSGNSDINLIFETYSINCNTNNSYNVNGSFTTVMINNISSIFSGLSNWLFSNLTAKDFSFKTRILNSGVPSFMYNCIIDKCEIDISNLTCQDTSYLLKIVGINKINGNINIGHAIDNTSSKTIRIDNSGLLDLNFNNFYKLVLNNGDDVTIPSIMNVYGNSYYNGSGSSLILSTLNSSTINIKGVLNNVVFACTGDGNINVYSNINNNSTYLLFSGGNTSNFNFYNSIINLSSSVNSTSTRNTKFNNCILNINDGCMFNMHGDLYFKDCNLNLNITTGAFIENCDAGKKLILDNTNIVNSADTTNNIINIFSAYSPFKIVIKGECIIKNNNGVPAIGCASSFTDYMIYNYGILYTNVDLKIYAVSDYSTLTSHDWSNNNNQDFYINTGNGDVQIILTANCSTQADIRSHINERLHDAGITTVSMTDDLLAFHSSNHSAFSNAFQLKSGSISDALSTLGITSRIYSGYDIQFGKLGILSDGTLNVDNKVGQLVIDSNV
jgi:hypothetical protein